MASRVGVVHDHRPAALPVEALNGVHVNKLRLLSDLRASSSPAYIVLPSESQRRRPPSPRRRWVMISSSLSISARFTRRLRCASASFIAASPFVVLLAAAASSCRPVRSSSAGIGLRHHRQRPSRPLFCTYSGVFRLPPSSICCARCWSTNRLRQLLVLALSSGLPSVTPFPSVFCYSGERMIGEH